MAGNVIELALRLKDAASGPLSDVAKEAKAAADAANNSGKRFKITGKMLAGMGAAAVGVSVAFGAMIKSLADSRNELIDTSTRTGLTTETIAALRLAAEGSGLELANLATGLQQLPKRMADMARGTGEAKVAFEALGVSVLDSAGELRSSDDVLKESLVLLTGVESSTQQAALATQLFGEAGTGLLQALSGTELESFVEQAALFGISVGPDAAKAAGDLQREIANFGLISERAIQSFLEGMGGKEGGAAGAVKFLSASLFGLAEVFSGVMAWGRKAFSVITNSITDVFVMIVDLGSAVADVFAGNFEKAAGRAASAIWQLKNGMNETVDIAKALPGDLGDALTGGFAKGVAAFNITTAGTGGGGRRGEATQVAKVDDKGDTKASKAADALKAFEDQMKSLGTSLDKTGASMSGPIDKSQQMRNDMDKLTDTFRKSQAQARKLGVESSDAFSGLAVHFNLMQDAAKQAIAEQEIAEQRARSSEKLGKVEGGLKAAAGGPEGALAMAGPWGAIIAAISSIGKMGADGIMDMMDSFHDSIIAFVTDVVPRLITEIPEKMLEHTPEMIMAIVESIPKVLKAAFIDLPVVIAKGAWEALKKIWRAVKKFFADLWDSITPWQTGGVVQKTGLAYLHQGERIIPTSGASTQATMAGASNIGAGQAINISTNVVDPNAIDGLARMLKRELGEFGGGRSLDIFNTPSAAVG
jgi:hypothetical protein